MGPLVELLFNNAFALWAPRVSEYSERQRELDEKWGGDDGRQAVTQWAGGVKSSEAERATVGADTNGEGYGEGEEDIDELLAENRQRRAFTEQEELAWGEFVRNYECRIRSISNSEDVHAFRPR